MALDTNLNGVGNGTVLTSTFQDFEFDQSLSGDELVISILVLSSEVSDEIALDNVRIVSE